MLMHIVGNRPQLIKLAPLSRELRRRGYQDIIIHTGQHYDENMSDVFFKELEIPKPYKNLRIGSGTHAEVTGKALIEIEKVILELDPKVVIVYGDTNSTLAAALAAVKVGKPVIHIEAGPRSYEGSNPEEINRRMIDHISTVLCCPDQASVNNLALENVRENVYNTGDIMYDTFLYCRQKQGVDILKRLSLEKEDYILMTWHRQENTSSKERMLKILQFIEKLKNTVLWPVHPRTRKMLQQFELYDYAKEIANLKMMEPVGYLDMVNLLIYSKLVVCDSGGVSKETYFAGKKCYFMLNWNPWKELVDNKVIKTIDFNDHNDVDEKIRNINEEKKYSELPEVDIFGKGNTAQVIVDILGQKELI